MSNNVEAIVQVEDYEENDTYGKDDFSFVLGPDGDLKSFIMPQHLMHDAPDEVKLILSMFGIDDIYELDNKTLH